MSLFHDYYKAEFEHILAYVWGCNDENARCYGPALQLLHLKPVPGQCSRRTQELLSTS